MLNPSLNRKPAGRMAVLITSLAGLLIIAPLIVIGAQQRTQPVAALTEIVAAPAVFSTVKAAEPAPKPATLAGSKKRRLAQCCTI